MDWEVDGGVILRMSRGVGGRWGVNGESRVVAVGSDGGKSRGMTQIVLVGRELEK
jgi:hypothetical protein